MIRAKTLLKLVSAYLTVAMILVSLPAPGWAMFMPSAGPGFDRESDIASVQKVLESAVVKQRLTDFGLSSEEAVAKMKGLSDEQVHQFASKMDSLQAGGDDGLIFVLVVVILVLVILQLTGHHVIVR